MAEAAPDPEKPAKKKLEPIGVPDGRGWVAIAVFSMSGAILLMIRENPALLANASFMQIAQTIVGAGGLGLVVAFHYASSSGTAKANSRADDAEKRAAAAAPDPTKDQKP